MTLRAKENWEKIYRTALFGLLVFFGTRQLNDTRKLQEDISGLKADMAVLKAESTGQFEKRAEVKNRIDVLESRLNNFIQFAQENYAMIASE